MAVQMLRQPLMLLMTLALAALTVGTGVFELRTGRLPGWMVGSLRWPLGASITRSVARLQGVASLLLGTVLAAEMVSLQYPHWALYRASLIGAELMAAAIALLLAWSIVLSRRPQA